MMIYVGIRVANGNHGWFNQSAEDKILADVFTISSNMVSFGQWSDHLCLEPLTYRPLPEKPQSVKKTDLVVARTIAAILLTDAVCKSYTEATYHNEALKSLTRCRFNKVKERTKLKSSVSRLV